ncbi:molecular chaperone Hsp33 [Allopseudospirillum japonicum]|uniref:33 kDa chaperonin n=1 Tax=Allopseudospirillum japonicum TaxID=64971 RepID=A0A1H6RW67_9GAMM|nr:Hsp33 family molecular chaperone HslO [Allopseudospirillum japonicum]SEI56777.1 molecular chaperone Hsp33 [Allopseudospirillum japonicum]
MSTAEPQNFDQIQRFLVEGTPVRGELVQLETSYQQIIKQQAYPVGIQKVLGELLAAVTLITETLKLEGTLSLEVRSSAAVSLLMAESNPGGDVRALARWQAAQIQTQAQVSLGDLVGDQGHLVITLDPKKGKRYQGIVALSSPNLAECLQDYFSQSEQLPTRFWLMADPAQGRAAGLLLQSLPMQAGDDEDAWSRLTQLADTLKAEEALQLEAQTVLYRLYHEETVRVFPAKTLQFACTCSRERTQDALLGLGAQEVESILAEQGQIETQCQFCHTQYVFTEQDLRPYLSVH